MQQQTLHVEANADVVIRSVPGDLRVAGWERNEVMAKTDGDSLELVAEGGEVRVACDENLILYLPRPANLHVDVVRGDASLQALSGAVRLGEVAGDLSLNDVESVSLTLVAGDAVFRNVGRLQIETISGDFALRGGRGDCLVRHVGGNASVRDVEGAAELEAIGADLYLRNVRGGVRATAAADATLYIDPAPGAEYHITAGDDLMLCLPPDASAELHLAGGAPDSVHVDLPGVALDEQSAAYDLVIGEGERRACLYLTAGDDLLVTGQADRWYSAADFGVGMRDPAEWGLPEMPPIPPIPPIPPDLSDRINRRVQAAMERSRERIEAASRRTEAKVEAAMRRAEAKARAAEVRARRGQVQMNIGRWNWDLTPRGPVEKTEPVSEEERLQILKMLQEKKITVEEAEKLLAALEGKA